MAKEQCDICGSSFEVQDNPVLCRDCEEDNARQVVEIWAKRECGTEEGRRHVKAFAKFILNIAFKEVSK